MGRLIGCGPSLANAAVVLSEKDEGKRVAKRAGRRIDGSCAAEFGPPNSVPQSGRRPQPAAELWQAQRPCAALAVAGLSASKPPKSSA